MKRPVRILLNVLLPPLLAIGGLLVTCLGIAATSELSRVHSNGNVMDMICDVASFGLMISFYAYVIGSIPSLLHAVVMEFVYLKFPADRWSSVHISTLSGSLAGLLIAGFLTKGPGDGMAVLIALGCTVGLTLGLIIKRLSRIKIESPASALHGCE